MTNSYIFLYLYGSILSIIVAIRCVAACQHRCGYVSPNQRRQFPCFLHSEREDGVLGFRF